MVLCVDVSEQDFIRPEAVSCSASAPHTDRALISLSLRVYCAEVQFAVSQFALVEHAAVFSSWSSESFALYETLKYSQRGTLGNLPILHHSAEQMKCQLHLMLQHRTMFTEGDEDPHRFSDKLNPCEIV